MNEFELNKIKLLIAWKQKMRVSWPEIERLLFPHLSDKTNGQRMYQIRIGKCKLPADWRETIENHYSTKIN